jgi:phage recombination protein Bet
MSNVVALRQSTALRDYTPEQMALIRRTVAADTTADEFNMFIEICRRAGLDPFRKQLYCLVYSKDNPDKRKVAFITGIDGLRALAARNGDYRPDDAEPSFVFDDAAKDPETNPKGFVKATVKAFKRHDGEWHPVVGVAYWNEFAPLKEIWAEPPGGGKRKPTGRFEIDKKGNWFRMPHVMLGKCAEGQALRKGWPEDLSGIHSTEEMERPTLDITATAAVEQHEREQRMQRIGAVDTVSILWRAGEPIEAVAIGRMHDRCAEFIAKSESVVQLEVWRDSNKVGLQQFWAKAMSDALAVKTLLEARIEELGKE